jgi:peptide/nickel transport system substrate-binding protein
MAKVLGFGEAQPLHYIYWTKGQLGYDESLPRYDYNPGKAKQLLTEAGFPNGVDVTLEYISRAEDQRIAEVAKDMLDKAGIRTMLSAAERLAFVDKCQKSCSCMSNFGRMGNSPDTDGHSRLVVTGGAANYTCITRPEVDKCMEEGRSTYDPAKRHEIYKRCISILYETAHQSAGYTRAENYVFPKYLKGAKAQWVLADLKEAWLDK